MAANPKAPNAVALSCHRLLSAAASVNATIVLAAPALVKTLSGYNARGSAVYLKLYNKAEEPSEADTPVMTQYLAASSYFERTIDLYFGTGFSYRMTTAGADNDTGALSSGDILGMNIVYI